MWKIENQRDSNSIKVQQKVDDAFESLLQKTELGYLREDLLEKSIIQCRQHGDFFNSHIKMVVVGLGGSSLGTRALVQGLHLSSDKEIHFLDNVDSQSVDHFLNSMEDPSEWLWYLCSKSGGTIEVTSLYDYCHEWIEERHGVSILKRTAVATETKKSPLFDLAQKYDLPCLEIPLDVGGRFSAFTPVGLFPMMFLGANLQEIREGVEQALSDKKMCSQLVQALWDSHQNNESILYSFQYCDRLVNWGLWLQQLWSESLGKKEKVDGQPADPVATFVPCRGASDQHSVLQQVMQGPEKKMVLFHRVLSSEKGQHSISKSLFDGSLMEGRHLGELLGVEASATEMAIEESQTRTMVLKTDELREKSLSYLMMTWMISVGVMGELLAINAFDQPGVESGKIITRRVLSQPH